MIRRLVAAGAIVAAVVLTPAIALAHPLGNFTVNHYAGIEVSPGTIRVVYALDIAEIPTVQLQPTMDANADGTIDDAETAAWAQAEGPQLIHDLEVTVDGRRMDLRAVCSVASFSAGQGGLRILRYDGLFEGEAPDAGTVTLVDRNDAGKVGWREITAVGTDGRIVSDSSVPSSSRSDALRRYPTDLLSSPLTVTQASFSYMPGSSDAVAAPTCRTGTASGARPIVDSGAFAGLVDKHGTVLVTLGLVLAVVFGAWHALLPGHGKTLMAAYMVGSEAKVRQAVAVGSAVAVMHTASVLALGTIVLTLRNAFSADRLYPWLGLASGLIAIGLGAYLLIMRLSVWSAARRHAEGHRHDADREPEHDHRHGDAHEHGHSHELPKDVAPISRRGLLALALAGGILPSPSAVLVLLAAIQADRIAYGLGLILAFSAGLAVALIALGLGALRAREAMARRLSSFWGRLIPVLSAGAIAGVGVFLAVRGFTQVVG